MTSRFLQIREESRLEQDEAAAALAIGIEEIREYESGTRMIPYPEAWLRKIFTDHLRSIYGPYRNRVFGAFPLTIFRTTLGLSMERVSRFFGYTPEEWRRIELHQVQLPEESLEKANRFYQRLATRAAREQEI